jgi:ankyrin repeat protein
MVTNERTAWELLSLAAKNGHEAIVKLLLEKGIDINIETEGDGAPYN